MAPEKQNTITLKDVAKHAGVHVSTVSRALKAETRSMVAPAVVERVVAAANRLGYRPDPVAASLRTGKSKLVGILVPDMANSVFAPILSGASEQLGKGGYAVIVADVGNDTGRQLELANGLAAHRVDGFVIATVRRDDPLVDFFLERRYPAVLVNRAESHARLSAVVTDDELGMQLAVDHLVSLGHKKIGHVAGPMDLSTGYHRRKGFTRAMAKHGLTVDGRCQVAKAYGRDEGAAAMIRLLDTRSDVTAVVAANDLLALGVYDALHQRRLRCPKDISVVGHNDMPHVDMVDPPLTTVRISHREMGRQAAELLQEAIECPSVPTKHVVLRPVLIERSSTSAPLPGARRRRSL